MIDFFINIATSMSSFSIFCYPVAAAFCCGLIMLIRSFFGKGITV
jgi:hypothetical protein